MSRRAIFLSLLFCASQSTGAFEDELKLVAGLTEEGFPKLAEKVLFRTLEKYPEAEAAVPELRVRILIADKKFDEAGSALATLHLPPATQEALWLFLAGKASGEQAVNAYQNYFALTKAPTDQAVFSYGELLEEQGCFADAITLYERADSRPVKAKLAALLVEDDPDRAIKLAEEVQLGGLDLWFGNAVVTWSQGMIFKGEWDEAQSVLEMQLELLKQLEQSLEAQGQPVSLVSPLSGARYWLGVCYEHEDKKAAALTQFYNVYAKYGDSEWGPKAQEKAQALKEEFEAQGKTVKIELGANLAKMEESTFRVARRLFFDRQYADAVPAYLDALNEYPEGSESVTALRELCVSSIQLGDTLSAKTVAAYLAERFPAEPKAGEALFAAGKTALDKQQEPLAWWIYDLAIEAFPSHPKTPAVLYSLAGLRKDEGYLKRILDAYPDSAYHARALGRLAWNAYAAEDFQSAAERFAPYVDTETDLQKQTRARFAYADSYRQLAQQTSPLRLGSVGDVAPPIDSKLLGRASLSERAASSWESSLESFQTLEKAMEKAAASFGVSSETLTFNRPYWEKSIYYQAVCQKELGNADGAVETCDRFLEQFPRSEIAEQVQFTKAKTLIESERFAEALVALEELDGKFAEPACYYRGLAQYETGAYEQSFRTLEKHLITWPASAFTYEVLFVQGRAYNAAGRTDDAIRVFGEIMSFASDDELLHRASLELGRAQTDPSEKLASFQRVALLADPEKHADLIAQALFESLPLYLELNRPDDLLADADRLLSGFPNLGNPEEIQVLKTKAEKMQMEETTNERE